MAVLFERRYHRGLGRVYICDGGRLGDVTLPEDFTDRGGAPDSEPLNAEVLMDLAAVVSVLQDLTAGRR